MSGAALVAQGYDVRHLAFHVDGRFLHPKWAHEVGGNGCQAAFLELVNALVKLCAGDGHLPHDGEVDGVDDDLRYFPHIIECVLHGIVRSPAVGAEHENGWVGAETDFR